MRGGHRKKSQAVTSSSLDFRGGFCMMSTSGGLKPSAVAGGPSVTRFTHNSCRRRRSLRRQETVLLVSAVCSRRGRRTTRQL